MPAELTTDPEPPSGARQAPSRSWLRDVGLLLVGFAVVGALCGLLWQWWWSPPSGVVVDHGWYPDPDGVDDTFTGTATYAVIGLPAGLVLGGLSAWLLDRRELLTLAAVVCSSVLAGWLMYVVGTTLAPPDPAAAARSAADYTHLRGTLTVSGWGAFAALPGGALLGLAGVYLGVAPTRRVRP